jgi:hypothetical protein
MFGRMFRASRRQSHPWEMEDTDSCTAPARTGPPGRTAPNTSPGIEENARAAPSRDGARRPRRAEEPQWTSASCGVFAVRVRRLRGVASHQHVAGLEQHALALQDEGVNLSQPPNGDGNVMGIDLTSTEGVHSSVHIEVPMPAIKVGVREFREQIARFLESDAPVAVTRRGETLGVYVPTPRKSVKSADMTELRAAADRLAAALSDVDEEEIVAEFKQMRRGRKAAAR